MTRMINCPDEFYENCNNALVHCVSCSAGFNDTSKKVYYAPRDKELEPHPQCAVLAQKKKEEKREKQRLKREKKKTTTSRQVRSGYKKEREVKNKINALVGTVRSGAVYGDGDYSVLRTLQADHKYRITKRSFSISREEYEKGKAEGTDHWIITVPNPRTKTDDSVVILTTDAYSQLLALALEGQRLLEEKTE